MILKFKGSGGEFQYHRLNKEDVESLKAEYLKNPADEEFLANNLGGGNSFSDALCSGCYGVDINNMEIFIANTNDIVANETIEKVEIQLINDEDYNPQLVDYIYLTQGKVFGTIKIDLAVGEIFNPEFLKFEYLSFSLDSYVEEYGAILQTVLYKETECEVNTEDNGLESRKVLLGYLFEDEEFFDFSVITDTNDEIIFDIEKIAELEL